MDDELVVSAFRKVTELTPEEQLEADMRRYLYDRTPDRRLKCLQDYRRRKGLPPWEGENERKKGS